MTDNEIINALECCLGRNGWGDPKCYECPFDGSNPNIGCKKNLLNNAIGLINRQKAEFDRLQIENDSLWMAANSFKMHYNTARAEAIKEFADNFKKWFSADFTYGVHYIVSRIDSLVKEMTGENTDE